jgi:putative transposase
MQRKSYSSDLTDSQWQQIKTFFDTHRRRQHDLRRDVLDGLLYLVKTGCRVKGYPSQRMLPGGFAMQTFLQWQTVNYYFRKWHRQGLVGRLLSVARRKAREESGRAAEPSALIIDCQSGPDPPHRRLLRL